MRGAAIAVALALALMAGQGARADVPGRMSDMMGDLLGAVDPWFRDLGRLMGDLTGWHAPEVLPNGDILIRRRRPQDSAAPDAGRPDSDQPDAGSSAATDPFEL
ncbi:MAG: hypothetical protein H6900_08085 [Rhodobacter sp.]|mgnify:CR=1 FL=1|uniref:hypothetical protein n=1 Tax=Pararhodobacter sp. TaxID=2127056 RepID=UPI001D65DB13|nr:hypothetical protein [Pararhodobacter sp.]MCB1346826.1 hypothetical protein [Paracoccaceae bacterium]MCC0073237.1 hypothetical protein [Rhodobacter sp.]HPD94070.1 hypothetical protein [Pararhodobacter sp.]